jgi:hypothetical protein
MAMATDNKGVMVYLPPDLQKVLEEYCTENNITRRNKDGEMILSMGTGIIHYLNSHLLGTASSVVLDDVPDPGVRSLTINRDSWDDLTADVADLREQLAQLAAAKKDLEPSNFAQLAADVANVTEEIHARPNGLWFKLRGLSCTIDDAVDKDYLTEVVKSWDDRLDRVMDCTISALEKTNGLIGRVEKLEAHQLIAPASKPNHVEKTLDVLTERKGFGKISS